MEHKLGVSGSTIFSNPELYSELFWEQVEHIEIGEFPNEEAVDKFLELCKDKNITFGIHSPLLRNGSKYDLIEKVNYDSKYAFEQLELEAEKMSALGAKYLLVHFPYFKEEVDIDTDEIIEEGLKNVTFVFEHTPETNPNKEFVNEGYNWVNSII